jgi:hypothetical protein
MPQYSKPMISAIESFEYNGVWWPFEDQNNRVNGILTYVPNQKSILSLADTFDDSERIKGISSDGKKITLHKCHQIAEHHNVPGFVTSEYSPEIILVGNHFSETLNFTEVSINYSYLDQWLGLSGFKAKYTGRTTSISYRKPMRSEIKINKEFNMEISFAFSFERSLRDVRMHQTAFITTRSKEEMSLEKFNEKMFQTMNLISLAIREPVSPLIINAKTKSFSDQLRIYYPYMNNLSSERSIHPLNMLFEYRDISKSINSYLKNWFSEAKWLEPTFNLYFDTIYTPRLTIQNKFLNMVQALEAYHRRKENMRNYESSDKVHSIRIENIISNAPSEYKEWLGKKLEYSNEVYLSKRLEDILNVYGEIIETYLPSKRKRKDFIGKVTEYRNTLTHFDPKKELPKDEDISEIYPLVKNVVELCLLTELGFDSADILRLIKKEDDANRTAIIKIEKVKKDLKNMHKKF